MLLYRQPAARRPGLGAAAVLVLALVIGAWPSGARGDDLAAAMRLADEGRYEETRQIVVSVLEQRPDDLRAGLLWGILQMRAGHLGEAARRFETLRDSHPDRFEPYNNLAAVYVAQGRLDDAHAALLAAVAREPGLSIVHENLADLYLRLARRSQRRGEIPAPPPTAGPGPDPRPAGLDDDRAVAVDRAAEQIPEETLAGAGAAAARAEVCARAVGFRTAAEAAAAEAWLAELGAVGRRRQELREVVKEHWVFRRPLPSRAEAVAAVQQLRAKGVEDLAIIDHGDLANGISLGIYRSTDNMRRRVAALESIGVPVQYETTLESATTYSVATRFPVLPAFLRGDWAARFPNQPLVTTGCDGSE